MGKRAVGYIGLIIAAILLCFGIFTKIPEKEISFYNFDGNGYTEYVGGDAYNIQIEASLRGGEIAGAKTAKAVFISSASIIFVISLSLFIQTKEKAIMPPAENNQSDVFTQETDEASELSNSEHGEESDK